MVNELKLIYVSDFYVHTINIRKLIEVNQL